VKKITELTIIDNCKLSLLILTPFSCERGIQRFDIEEVGKIMHQIMVLWLLLLVAANVRSLGDQCFTVGSS
jgi:K+ transporter